MTHSVNLVGWLLAVTETHSLTGKSIEHAVPQNAGKITIEKHHCMPILPCLHIVSYPFFFFCQGIKWCLIPHAKVFLQTNHSQTEKAIRQMQLAYKEDWIHDRRRWKDILRLLVRAIHGMNIHLPNFPTVCVSFIFHIMFVFCRHNGKTTFLTVIFSMMHIYIRHSRKYLYS